MQTKSLTIIGMLLSILILNSCKKEDNANNLSPNAGLSYFDIESDGYTVTLSAEEPITGQSGVWRIYSGQNGSFDDATNPQSIFRGEPGESYRLGWEVSDGKDYMAETITVSFKPLMGVIATDVADTLFNNVSLELEAEAALYGAQGHWTIESGEGGRIENADNNIAQFIGKEGQKYKLNWTLTFGTKSDNQSLAFCTDTLKADAGADNLDVVSNKELTTKFTDLNAFLPAGASGVWELLGNTNGQVLSLTDPTSVFKGTSDVLYQLKWTVALDDYISVDTLNIRFRDKWGKWKDERDGQSYRYVEINGLEWMADNYNYHSTSYQQTLEKPYANYINSWYYGQSSRAQVIDGVPVEGENACKLYGRLYNYFAAYYDAPEGWRLPTREEFESLGSFINSKGLTNEALLTNGQIGLDMVLGGSMSYSGGNGDSKDIYAEQGISGYYMTADYMPDSFGVLAMALIEERIGLYVIRAQAYFNGFSVRYVREVEQ